MENELLPGNIKRALFYSPVISQGLLWDKTLDTLQETQSLLKEKIESLNRMEITATKSLH